MKSEQNSSVLPHSLRNFAVKISRVLKKRVNISVFNYVTCEQWFLQAGRFEKPLLAGYQLCACIVVFNSQTQRLINTQNKKGNWHIFQREYKVEIGFEGFTLGVQTLFLAFFSFFNSSCNILLKFFSFFFKCYPKSV